MLFSSPTFVAFFVIYLALHFWLPTRFRVFLIIAGSAIFYAWWKVEYGWIPFFLMAIAYGGVLWSERATDQAARKRRTVAIIAALFLPLVFFKYTNFIRSE